MTNTTYTIKPLEWDENHDPHITGNNIFDACSGLDFKYRVGSIGGQVIAYVKVSGVIYIELERSETATINEAKAVCESDWLERIGGALNDTSISDTPENKDETHE